MEHMIEFVLELEKLKGAFPTCGGEGRRTKVNRRGYGREYSG